MTLEQTSPGRALQQALDAWNAAGRRWDPAALTACFTDDGLFFGGRPQHCVGREAIRGYFDSYVGIIESIRLELRDQHLVETGPGFVLAQGWGDFTFVLAGNRHTQSVVRTTWLLQRQPDGSWKIRQQHFAPPPAVPPLGKE